MTKKTFRQACARVLVGKPFWELWGGKVFHTVVMAAVVAWTLQLFQDSIGEFVNTNVQSTLLHSLAEPDFVPPPCARTTARELANCISVVAIDDADFRGLFQQQSPLNPDTLRKLFEALLQAPPRVVAIDLDLSPASAEDWPARERLLDSLQALARVSRLVMVCPQGYSTPQPGPLDREWVNRFDHRVRFASAELNVDGLYFNKLQQLPTLGVATAEAAAESLEAQPATEHAPAGPAPLDWHTQCLGASAAADSPRKNELIRPLALASGSFSQALAQPAMLADRVVLVGGKWGINDQFKLRGQSDAFFGVTLHAWVSGTELAPAHEPPESAALIMELVIGMLAGVLFSWVWRGIANNGAHFAMRSVYYLLFFLLAFGLPVVWITVAAHLAKLGLVLGAAGMVLSAAADSFLSSHEAVLEGAEKETIEEHEAHEVPAGTGLARLLALGLALALFAVTWTWGHSFWVCLVSGGLGGLALGAIDRHERHGRIASQVRQAAQAAARPGTTRHAAPPEATLDLLARLLWTVLKGLALYWLFGKDHHFTTTALVLGFLGCWCLAYGWDACWARLGRAGLSRA